MWPISAGHAQARFGKPLEEVCGRDKSVEGFRRALDPMRLTLKTQAFSAGRAELCRTTSCSADPVGALVSPFNCSRE